jgi:hypothetical protein
MLYAGTATAGGGVDEAVAALRNFALVERETIADERDPAITTDCIRLHRLVREVAAARAEGEAREPMLRALIAAMAAVYPEGVYNNPTTWPRARRLDALALALCLALCRSDEGPPRGSEMNCAHVLSQLGVYRHFALATYEHALRLYVALLAPKGITPTGRKGAAKKNHARASHMLPNPDFWEASDHVISSNSLIFLGGRTKGSNRRR